MTETSAQSDSPTGGAIAAQPRSLYLISLLLTGVVTLLFYFSLTGIPLQGADLDLFALPHYLNKSVDALFMREAIPNAPLARWLLLSVWDLSQGSSVALRLLALSFHLFSVLYFFGIIRRWTGKQESVVVPLLGSLLYCVLPTVPPMLATGAGFSQLSGGTFALIAANSYLAVTENPDRRRFFHFCATLLFSLLALGACYDLIVLPLLLLLLDATRLEKHREIRLAPDWTMLLAVTAVLALLSGIICISDSPVLPEFFIPWHLLGMIAILLPGRFILRSRIGLIKNILLVCCNVLLIVLGVFAFQSTMAFWEPLAQLQKEGGTDQSGRAALQCLTLAQAESISAERIEGLRQAALLWNVAPPGLEAKGLYRLAYGRVLEETGKDEEARAVYTELHEAFPFAETGIEAVAGLARIVSTENEPALLADLLNSLSKQRNLSDEEKIFQALAHMQLGDVQEAAIHFSRVDLPAQAATEKQLKEQSLQLHATIQSLVQESQQKAGEDATSMEIYVSLSESLLLAGNHLQAYYWLNFALRRDNTVPKAWELLGVLCALKGNEKEFIQQWGQLKADDARAWVDLGHKAAFSQAWDGAWSYLRQAGDKVELTAEEMMAVFYLEQKRVEEGEHWLRQAMELMPDAARPRLLLADLAIAMEDKEKARNLLEEARQRNAPEAEISRRLAVLDGTAPEEGPPPALRRPTQTPEQTESFPPAAPTRTLIE